MKAERLVDILRQAAVRVPDGELFLPKSEEWSVNTLGEMIDVDERDDAEVTEEGVVVDWAPEHSTRTLMGSQLCEIAKAAAQLQRPLSDEVLFEAFMYYFRFDAFLPAVGAPAPTPVNQTLHKIDREFYDALGNERPLTKCAMKGCDRGVVNFSLFCKVHHFESIKQKPCPFAY